MLQWKQLKNNKCCTWDVYRNVSNYILTYHVSMPFSFVFAYCTFFTFCLADVGIASICSRGFSEPNNFNFHATTKSWHAHQKIRLDAFIWTKWVSEICMKQFIELSIKPFQNPLFWQLFVLLKSLNIVTIIACCNREDCLKYWML